MRVCMQVRGSEPVSSAKDLVRKLWLTLCFGCFGVVTAANNLYCYSNKCWFAE